MDATRLQYLFEGDHAPSGFDDEGAGGVVTYLQGVVAIVATALALSTAEAQAQPYTYPESDELSVAPPSFLRHVTTLVIPASAPVGTTFNIPCWDPDGGNTFSPVAVKAMYAGAIEDGSGTGFYENWGHGFATSPTSRRCTAFHSANGQTTADVHGGGRDDALIAQVSSSAFVGLVDLDAITAEGFRLIVDEQLNEDLTVVLEAWGGDLEAALIAFEAPASTGDQDYNVGLDLATGRDDKVVIIIGSAASGGAIGTLRANSDRHDIGVVAGNTPVQWCIGGGAVNGVADMVTASYMRVGECIGWVEPDNVTVRASLTAWLANGFRLNWAETSTGHHLFALVLKGQRWQAGTALTQTVTDTPRQTPTWYTPKYLLVGAHGRAESASDTVTQDDIKSVGAAASISDRAVVGIADWDAGASSLVAVSHFSTAIYNNEWSGGRMDVDSFDVDGFTTVMETFPDDQEYPFGWLIGAEEPPPLFVDEEFVPFTFSVPEVVYFDLPWLGADIELAKQGPPSPNFTYTLSEAESICLPPEWLGADDEVVGVVDEEFVPFTLSIPEVAYFDLPWLGGDDEVVLVSQAGEVFADASVRIALPGEAQEDASANIAQNGESQEAASANIAQNGESQEDASVRVAQNGESQEDASARMAQNGEAQEDASVNVAQNGEVQEDASINVALPGEVQEDASANVAQTGESQEDASVRVQQNANEIEDASVRVAQAQMGESQEDASVRVAQNGEVQKDASARVAQIGESQEDASARIAQAGESSDDASVRVEVPSEVFDDASANIALPGESQAAASANVAQNGEEQNDASLRVAQAGESQEDASANVTGRQLGEVFEDASANVAQAGESFEDASARVAQSGETQESGSVRTALPGEVFESASAEIALRGESSCAGSMLLPLAGEQQADASALISGLGEQIEQATFRAALQGDAQAIASVIAALVGETQAPGSLRAKVTSEASEAGSVFILIGEPGPELIGIGGSAAFSPNPGGSVSGAPGGTLTVARPGGNVKLKP